MKLISCNIHGILACVKKGFLAFFNELANSRGDRRNAGFTDKEREKMTKLLESGFVDTFRHFYRNKKDTYTRWSYITRARDRNVGWRIDYFVVSEELVDNIKLAEIHSEILDSDYCPVELVI